MAVVAHLCGGLLSTIGLIAIVVIWITQKDESVFVDDQAKEALNFQITVFLGLAISGLLTCVGIGPFLMLIVYVANLVLAIVAAVKVGSGERYRYPLCLRLLS